MTLENKYPVTVRIIIKIDKEKPNSQNHGENIFYQ